MSWPPIIPPNDRTNETLNEDNHPADHNESSDALTAIVGRLGTPKRKSSGTARTATGTPTIDPDLANITLAINSAYRVTAILFYDAVVGDNMKFNFINLPAGATLSWTWVGPGSSFDKESGTSTQTALTAGSGVNKGILITGILTTSSTSETNFGIAWCKSTHTSGNLNLQALSTLVVEVI
jgi:hypothetical protein